MFFTNELKKFEVGYPDYNSERTYWIQYWEREKSTYKHRVLEHISSEGVHTAITFDVSSNEFVLDLIAPM